MSIITVSIKEKGNLVYIKGFPTKNFQKDLYKHYKSTRVQKFFNVSFTFLGKGTIMIHKSFLPELVYVLNQLPKRGAYNTVINKILENTWMSSTLKSFPDRISTSKFSDFKYNLKPYQLEFIKDYNNKKQRYNLKGNILAFEQGLGKTFTSIALMYGLNKEAVIIIAPKSTLKTVWKNEIETIFKVKKDIWVIGEPPKKSDYYIVNYESIDKLSTILNFVNNKNVGIIVDETHNFRNVNAQRVKRLISIANTTNCDDILLMSGTPIKALGSEMLPTLQLLDRFFDTLAQKVFLAAFGVSVPIALDILKNRLGFMMHRKTKVEVESLPKKTRKDIKIKVPNGNDYTLDNVKNKIQKFIKEREIFYKKNKLEYELEWKEVIDYLIKNTKLKGDYKFGMYLNTINKLKTKGYNTLDKKFVKEVADANKYEKAVIRPLLPSELKHKFDRSKAVIKYVNLKIMGEVLGGLLTKLRKEMFSEMLKNSPICEIIKNSEKKTVCFSTFVDVVKVADDHLRNKCDYDPVLVFGETSGAITNLLKNFREDTKRNPLIATVQTLSTGVTLIEANTIIFLNKPWRHTDASQAEDRVHRIGQTTDVEIFTFILDTGNKPNLSTRMEDIVQWSKEMFEGIVGKDTQVNKAIAKSIKKYKGI